MRSKLIQILLMAGAVLGVLSIAACSQREKLKPEFFGPPGQPSQVSLIADAQHNAGERADATLLEQHFDGAALNSLGMAKLDCMLNADSSYPVVVYLNVADDARLADRRTTVQNYLMDRGSLHMEQICLETGPNPATFTPAAPILATYGRTDSAGDSGGGSSGSSSSSSSSGSSGSSSGSSGH